MAEFNAEKSHLSDAESKILIDVIICQAWRGLAIFSILHSSPLAATPRLVLSCLWPQSNSKLPLTNQMIEDHANHILHASTKPGIPLRPLADQYCAYESYI